MPRTVIFLIFVIMASRSGGAQILQAPQSPTSSEPLRSLQERRLAAEASENHEEVGRIDLLIIAGLLRQIRDQELSRHNSGTAQSLEDEAVRVGTGVDISPLEPASNLRISPLGGSANLEEQELAVKVAETYSSLGTAYAHQAEFERALWAYRSAKAWSPMVKDINRNLGLVYAQLNRPNEAVRLLAPIVRTFPDDLNARFALAMSFSSLDRQREVRETLKPVTKLLPQKPATAYVYARALIAQSEGPAARNILCAALQYPMPPGIAFLIGRELVAIGDDTDALVALKISEQSDRVPRVYYFEAMVHMRLKQSSQAISLLEKQLQMTPADFEAEYALAFMQLTAGQTAEASQHLEKVLNEQPNHPDANYEFAKLLLERGDVESAIDHLQLAEKYAPDNPSIPYQLQLAYRKNGQLDDARRELDRYNSIRANQARGQKTLPKERQ